MVYGKCMIYRCRLSGEILAPGGFQCSLNKSKNPGKIQFLVKELCHRDFIGRVQDCGSAAPHLKRSPGKSKSGETIQIRTFKRQCGRLREIKSQSRTVDT